MVVSCALSFEIVGLQRQSAKQQCAVALSLICETILNAAQISRLKGRANSTKQLFWIYL